ncbi:hypothetical protein [Streptomyces sp. NBC_01462]|uniref:hypothetical protein n=1 Tax=Streptomyces sp. NBC_01462 TaxID=2903876 RepID=UPI002E30503C|nr:hypothetical protein [Streptomyces sp. NBC_01462]
MSVDDEKQEDLTPVLRHASENKENVGMQPIAVTFKSNGLSLAGNLFLPEDQKETGGPPWSPRIPSAG